ncbi:MAG TPA: YegS/Rv2252/BmrU family lipid kinase [Alphaproteobacteria bacterium]|jgi:YegS/Rv2252/BmrU family lipid kinase|nr:YegS/Rv2252/BmrU family lipid kinase [Alphaproteobacteria bacterium]
MSEIPRLLNGTKPPLRLRVIYNPVAGQRHGLRLRRTVRALERSGASLVVTETERAGDAERAAAAARSADTDILIAAGGDGTINEVVNGLMAAQEPVPPLGIIPLGTANVLAQEIGLSLTGRKIASAILKGHRVNVYPGQANGRYFLMMGGVGFDAEVVAHVDPAWKRRTGPLAYLAEAFNQSRRYPFDTCGGEIDGTPFEARWIVVCNGRHYGGPFIAAPAASLTEPGFSVCLLNGARFDIARYGLALALGRLKHQPDVRIVPAQHVRVDGPVGCKVQGDGDIIASLPVEIVAADRPIALVVPA